MQIPLPAALHLLHTSRDAVLSTHSTQLPGFPYGTAVPLVLDAEQRPILLVSALAEHTKNLLADDRASLAVVEAGQANVQDAARLTLVGHFEPCEAEPAMVERYLRYNPPAAQYLQLDFMFFRMRIERARFIGGIGKMGWLDSTAWQGTAVLSLSDETKLIAEAAAWLPATTQILGIDCLGIDYLDDGSRKRRRFDKMLDAAGIRQQLPISLI